MASFLGLRHPPAPSPPFSFLLSSIARLPPRPPPLVGLFSRLFRSVFTDLEANPSIFVLFQLSSDNEDTEVKLT